MENQNPRVPPLWEHSLTTLLGHDPTSDPGISLRQWVHFQGVLNILVIQFPPEMDENWVRYGLAKLGQISKLPNWQKIVVLCVHNTTSALNS